MGPSSALGGDSRATRSCNAILHNMTAVEAEHIAYICVQVSTSSKPVIALSQCCFLVGTLCDFLKGTVERIRWSTQL